MVDLSSLITEQTQVVEIYLCPVACNEHTNPILVGWKKLPKPTKDQRFAEQQGHTMRFYEYNHRDLTLSYDLENDAQRVIRKSLQKSCAISQWWAASFEEDVLPIHRFPSTQEITKEGHLTRTSFRINNRLFLYIDKEDDWEYLYIRYQHAPNVDLSKMQNDLDRLMDRITRW